MSASFIRRATSSGTALLVCALLAFTGSAPATAHTRTKVAKPPKVTTGQPTHIRGTAATLTGVITPNDTETTYHFEYGTTTAYGSSTPTLPTGSTTTKEKVGQEVTGLKVGVSYYYRLVAVSTATGAAYDGAAVKFTAGLGKSGSRLSFKLAKGSETQTYGRAFVISGTLAGAGGGEQPIALQASPYPYLEPFVTVGGSSATNAAGAFAFRVANLASSTQFRVVTLGKLPVYSPVVTEHVAIGLTLRVQKTRRTGVVRLYGFVTPAKNGAQVLIQLAKQVRPHGKAESDVRYVTAATAKVKHAGKTFSQFSVIVEVAKAGSYSAYIDLPKGALVSGRSNSISIHTTVPSRKGRKAGSTRKSGRRGRGRRH